MKDFFKFCIALVCGALAVYTAYLVYIKFVKEKDSEEDDLYEEESISFSERVKKAAQEKLEKIS